MSFATTGVTTLNTRTSGATAAGECESHDSWVSAYIIRKFVTCAIPVTWHKLSRTFDTKRIMNINTFTFFNIYILKTVPLLHTRNKDGFICYIISNYKDSYN